MDVFEDGTTSFDHEFVVVGSGFAAFGFITEILRRYPGSKILCIERGHDDQERHYTTLLEQSMRESKMTDAYVDTYPDVVPNDYSWQLSNTTSTSSRLNKCAGGCTLLGGRSAYWHGWCMRPDTQDLRGFPQTCLDSAKVPSFWRAASDLLNVARVDQIPGLCYGSLQSSVEQTLANRRTCMPSIIGIGPAYFANGSKSPEEFKRFSVAQRLKEFCEHGRLDIIMRQAVIAVHSSDGRGYIDIIRTDRGPLHIRNNRAKVILCAGASTTRLAIPNATILLNSFPRLSQRIGKSIGGHFRSHISARVPSTTLLRGDVKFDQHCTRGCSAHVLRGRDHRTGRRFHIQLSVFYYPWNDGNCNEIVAEMPRYGTAPAESQLKHPSNDLIISCTALGELDENNAMSWLHRLNGHSDMTCNVELQLSLSDNDDKLWDLMDATAFQAIETLAGVPQVAEYWDERRQDWVWQRPSTDQIRSPVLVHETGTTPFGRDSESSVLDENLAVHGCSNVFVTGSGIFPTAGSWNPTLTLCAFSQALARRLCAADTVVMRL